MKIEQERNPYAVRLVNDRLEVSLRDLVVIYDVFLCKGDTHICVVGHYDRIREPANMTCLFDDSRAMSQAIFIGDGVNAGQENWQVAVCLFPVPAEMLSEKGCSITLKSKEETYLEKTWIVRRSGQGKQHLSLATLFKDEVRFLKEWLDYNQVLGVDHFYLYDNNSKDREGVCRVLEPYVHKGIVTHLLWDYPYKVPDEFNSWRYTQRAQMHHALYKYGDLCRWMLFVDVDEYVYPVAPDQRSILPIIRMYEDRKDVAALLLNCMQFGNSGYQVIPDGPVIRNFIRRADRVVGTETGGTYRNRKYFADPRCCLSLFVHGSKRRVPGATQVEIPEDVARLNHYFSISSKGRIKNPHFNDVEDRGMDKFFPKEP